MDLLKFPDDNKNISESWITTGPLFLFLPTTTTTTTTTTTNSSLASVLLRLRRFLPRQTSVDSDKKWGIRQKWNLFPTQLISTPTIMFGICSAVVLRLNIADYPQSSPAGWYPRLNPGSQLNPSFRRSFVSFHGRVVWFFLEKEPKESGTWSRGV